MQKLLYICTHNRCRSILAEAITNHHAGSQIIAASAGSQPVGEVHPLSIKYLRERGIATDQLSSQSWNNYQSFNPDAVIYMCNDAVGESCPMWFGAISKINWGLSDPSRDAGSEQQIRQAFHDTMDIIEARIQQLLAQDLENMNQQSLSAALEAAATITPATS